MNSVPRCLDASFTANTSMAAEPSRRLVIQKRSGLGKLIRIYNIVFCRNVRRPPCLPLARVVVGSRRNDADAVHDQIWMIGDESVYEHSSGISRESGAGITTSYTRT